MYGKHKPWFSYPRQARWEIKGEEDEEEECHGWSTVSNGGAGAEMGAVHGPEVVLGDVVTVCATLSVGRGGGGLITY